MVVYVTRYMVCFLFIIIIIIIKFFFGQRDKAYRETAFHSINHCSGFVLFTYLSDQVF